MSGREKGTRLGSSLKVGASRDEIHSRGNVSGFSAWCPCLYAHPCPVCLQRPVDLVRAWFSVTIWWLLLGLERGKEEDFSSGIAVSPAELWHRGERRKPSPWQPGIPGWGLGRMLSGAGGWTMPG